VRYQYYVSYLFSVFVYIVIVNAINLIDGVDGLAGGIGMIASITFTYWFYQTGHLPLALLAASLGGALLGFLVFNFNPARIFMGDSGSLTIGVVMFVLATQMIEFPIDKLPYSMKGVSKTSAGHGYFSISAHRYFKGFLHSNGTRTITLFSR